MNEIFSEIGRLNHIAIAVPDLQKALAKGDQTVIDDLKLRWCTPVAVTAGITVFRSTTAVTIATRHQGGWWNRCVLMRER